MKKQTLLSTILATVALIVCSCSGADDHINNPKNKDGSMSYEIFVRSFYDSDGDGIGDLNGVAKKIPYLYDLGIKTVWLMPIHESPSYHGYDVVDYYSIEQDYGTLEDFDNLITVANEYNIDIMLDMVFNHSSHLNPYFIRSYEDYSSGNTSLDSKADWYNWSSTSKNGYNKKGNLYYESRFDSSMPDFNLDNQAVRDELENITKFWIERGVKGFRLDAVLYYYYNETAKNVEFLTWLEETAHKYDPDFYMVGECWSNDAIVNQYHQSKCDSFFRFSNAYKGDFSLINISKASGNLKNLLKNIESNEKTIKTNNPNAYASYFLSNHDQDRVSASYIDKDTGEFNLNQAKCAASLLSLMPGTPFMYYGEEIGLRGVRGNSDQSDAKRRLPMIWSKNNKTGQCIFPEQSKKHLDNTEQPENGVDDCLKDNNSLVNHYKKAIAVRNKYPFLKKGIFTSLMDQVDSFTPFIVQYKISLGDEYVIVIHNFTGEKLETTAAGTTIIDEINTTNVKPSLKGETLTIGAYSTVLMK